jgi:Secretion system C-terminal sorting domain
MKSKSHSLKTFLWSIIFIFINTNLSAQDFFPLEIGNRWDYFVTIDYPGGTRYDTLSIEILDKKILSNGIEYFEFSEPFPFLHLFPYPKYIREEENYINFFDEEDSVDCFAFRFDLPQDSLYFNCKNKKLVVSYIYTTQLFGINDSLQEHNLEGPILTRFSQHFGIIRYYDTSWLERFYYDLNGCKISGITYGDLLVSVDDEKIPQILSFNLEQNYPNPFNPSTKIKFTIPSVGTQHAVSVQLKVYDVLGNKVATLVNEEKPAGEYEVEFNAQNLASGIYFYQLRAGEFIQTKKMILLQ